MILLLLYTVRVGLGRWSDVAYLDKSITFIYDISLN